VDLGQQVIDVRAGCVVEASEATKSRQSEIETHLASRLNGAEFCHASREGRRLTSRQLFDSIVKALHDLLILLGHELQRATLDSGDSGIGGEAAGDPKVEESGPIAIEFAGRGLGQGQQIQRDETEVLTGGLAFERVEA